MSFDVKQVQFNKFKMIWKCNKKLVEINSLQSLHSWHLYNWFRQMWKEIRLSKNKRILKSIRNKLSSNYLFYHPWHLFWVTKQTVKFLPLWPSTTRTARAPTAARPSVLAVQTLHPISSQKIKFFCIPSAISHCAYALRDSFVCRVFHCDGIVCIFLER